MCKVLYVKGRGYIVNGTNSYHLPRLLSCVNPNKVYQDPIQHVFPANLDGFLLQPLTTSIYLFEIFLYLYINQRYEKMQRVSLRKRLRRLP